MIPVERRPYCLSFADMVPKHESPSTEALSEARLKRSSAPQSEFSTVDQIDLHFLGTVSSQPTPTRAHSCLAVRLDSEIWIFDAGESAQLQLTKSSMKAGKVSTIFITHLHGDHVFGLGPLVCSLAQAFGGGPAQDTIDPTHVSTMDDAPVQLEIYGPLGTRAFLRNMLKYTYSFTSRRWRVHELILPGETTMEADDRCPHPCEVIGSNICSIEQDGSTVFLDFLVDDEHRRKHPSITVHAAPIRHTVPTLGFVLQENSLEGRLPASYVPRIKAHPEIPLSILKEVKSGTAFTLPDGTTLVPPAKVLGRKLCILGDTYDPSNIASLARDSHVLIHEATNALVRADPETKASDTSESVKMTTISHGHSTPDMAGEYAKKINASTLILNHFSGRYRGDSSELSIKIMDEIRDLARKPFGRDDVYTACDWSCFNLSKDKKVVRAKE